MDFLTKERRSWNMSRVQSRNTAPEVYIRSMLYRNGYRFRLHVKKIPGTPDIVLSKHKIIIDIRGCFWHRHKNCRYAKIPKTRSDWWGKKLNKNVERDRNNIYLQLNDGWRILVIWECFLDISTYTDKQREDILKKVMEYFLTDSAYFIELSEKGISLHSEEISNE